MRINNNTIGYITVIGLLVIASFFSINLFFQEKQSHDKLNIRKFPYAIGEWNGRDLEVTKNEYDILETRNLILREYVNPKGDKITVFIVYSETNRSVFHPPEVCLIGSGIKILDKKSERIDSDKNKFLTNKLYVGKDNARELVLYCYKVGDIYTDNYYLQQAYFAINQVFRRRIKGATIRVSMPIGEKGEQYSLTTLKSFIKETAKIIDSLT